MSHSVDKSGWVVNLSKKPLTAAERFLLEKGLQLTPTPSQILYKNIVAEGKAAINSLPEESKDLILSSMATILHRIRPPTHKNLCTKERKALRDLKKYETKILMKADKEDCFVVLEKCGCESKTDYF